LLKKLESNSEASYFADNKFVPQPGNYDTYAESGSIGYMNHGGIEKTFVFAPHYKYRSEVVPKPKELSLVEELIECKTKPKSKSRISWARLLKRVFNIDVSKCNKCSGQIKIIAAIAAAERSCTASHAAAKIQRL
jgi:hypothetical protein